MAEKPTLFDADWDKIDADNIMLEIATGFAVVPMQEAVMVALLVKTAKTKAQLIGVRDGMSAPERHQSAMDAAIARKLGRALLRAADQADPLGKDN
jgi:hypothetical protein